MHRFLLLLVGVLLAAPSARAQTGLTPAASRLLEAQQTQLIDRVISSASIVNEARLDSIWQRTWTGSGWEDASRVRYLYGGGRRSATLRFWSDNGTLEPSTRTLFDYDVHGRLTSEVEQEFNATTEEFEPVTRSRYIYQGANAIPSETHVENWNQITNEFEPYDRTDTDLLVIEGQPYPVVGTSYEWVNGGWEPYDRYEIEQANSDVHFTSFEWAGSSWVPHLAAGLSGPHDSGAL